MSMTYRIGGKIPTSACSVSIGEVQNALRSQEFNVFLIIQAITELNADLRRATHAEQNLRHSLAIANSSLV
jgi:hypothetical protein